MNKVCRHCGSHLDYEFIDLGHQPPSNAYLTQENLCSAETTYPLKVFVCTHCWLVQIPDHASADQLFTADYAYFSSTSSSWCAHAESFVDDVVSRLSLGPNSFVVELASNDGYLLQYLKMRSIPCLGIEPTKATAEAARQKGIDTLELFFSAELANQLPKADLIIANNVLAHVPDINDFLSGIQCLLKPTGKVSIEFPHLLRLLLGNQFDTIYHEHYSYLSLRVVQRIASFVGLDVIDVEELATHGGSLRVWLAHAGAFELTSEVSRILAIEHAACLETIDAYSDLQKIAETSKYSLLKYLIDAKNTGRLICGYGAAAKGNTLLNYAGIRSDLIPVVADRASSKQNKFLPGSHIPVVSPEVLSSYAPDSILVLPWNLINEIKYELKSYTLVTAIPRLTFW